MKGDTRQRSPMTDLIWLLVGAVLYGVGTHCFIAPANIAPGGAMGVALMINYVSDLPVGLLTVLINLPLLALAWKQLSKRFALRTAIACVVCAVVLDWMVAPILPIYSGDLLLGSLYGGVIVGAGMALIFLSGSTTGGSDVVGYLLQRQFPALSIGWALMLVDSAILLLSIGVFQSVDAALFGLLNLYAQTKVIDMILYGSDGGSEVKIITQHPQKVSQRVIEELERTTTILKGQGAYRKQEAYLVLCMVRKAEFPRLKRMIQETDPEAFVMVTEGTRAFGLGFHHFSQEEQ